MDFQGSYYNGWPQFLYNGSSINIGVHNYQNVLNLPYYVNLFQPEVVVFEVAEYTLSDVYFDSNNMVSLKWNPALIHTSGNKGASVILPEDIQPRNTEVRLKVITGRSIDYAYTDKPIKDAEYAYLISQGRVFDFYIDDQKQLSIDLPNGQVSAGDKVWIVYQNSKGERYYDTVEASSPKRIGETVDASSGVTYDEFTKTITVTPSKNTCIFDSVVFQLLSSDGELIEEITNTTTKFFTKECFKNTGNDGEYILRIKVASNTQDEYIDTKIYLKEGDVYGLMYDVDELAEEVIINNFSLLE